MATGIVIDGKVWPLVHPITKHPIPVFGPEDHGMEFHPGDGYNKARRKPIDLVVWHWTGSENAPETMYKVLVSRKLGVEFAISSLGNVYQFCDPAKVDTADAGSVNARSIGVEIVNAGIRRVNTLWREPRNRKTKLGPREAYDTIIHGQKIRCWDFYPNQTEVACALASLFTDAIDTLPGVVAPGSDVLSQHDLDLFKGHCGHLQISAKKLDPGTQFLDNLRKHFSVNQPNS
jgi:N-acetyl-anhydromuramyl-L-alanine amidase AmpD